VTLSAPRGHSSVGFAGTEYDVRDGRVTVPDEAEAPLRAHGYRKAAPAPPVPASRKG